MRRALGISLGIVVYLGLFVAVSQLTENWDGFLPQLASSVLLGACVAPALALAVRYNVWGFGTLVRRRAQQRRDRRED